MSDPESTDPESTERQSPGRLTVRANLPLISFEYERELKKQAERLRDEFTATKRDELFAAIGSSDDARGHTQRRAQAELDYYLAMFQVNSAERGAQQLGRGTWVLAIATVGLVVATIVLIIVTAAHGK